MHVGTNNTLIEAQVGIDLLLCVVYRITVLLGELLVCQLFFLFSQGMLSDYNANPDKVVSLCLRKFIQVGVQKCR